MKVKRILSILITVCMLLSLIPAVSVSAETTIEWEYTVGVGISQIKNAECNKKNAITVKLKFTDNSEETKFLENTDSKSSPATAKFKTTRAPWTLNGVEFENSSKDSLWMHTIWIKVSRVGSSAEPEYVLLHYPGNANDRTSGQPIDQDDKGPASYPVSFDAKRQIWGTDNFMDALNKWYNLNPLGESGTIKAEWSGKINDTYVNFFEGAAYDCMGLSDAPTMKVTASGLKEDGTQVTKDNLVQNGVKFLDKGYEIDRATLIKYMNENNMGQIHLRFTLEFPETSTKEKRTFSATTTIRRRAFCVDSVSYSRNYGLSYSKDENVRADNRYYNNSSGNTVTATVYIKSTDQFAGYAYEFINKTVTIGEAYLTAGDDIKIPANETSVKTVGSKSFNLTFNLPNNVESGDAGLTLVIKDAYLDNSGTKYALWDSENKAKDLSLYTSTYKIDRKEPTFAIEPEAGVDLSKWHKTVTLYVTPSEKTYSGRGTPQEGYATMYLYGNGTYPAVYKYNDTEQNGTASAFQNVPSEKDFRQKITLALRDRVEGEYKLRFYGYDEAGNDFDSSYAGIKLDNKAPQISVTEKQEPQKSDGTKGNIYNVKISDASGTGRLYYMFTEKSRQDAPAFDENNDVPKSSGEMDTTLDRWAYIEQKDTENGNTAAAYLNVQKGQNFNGRILYFGIDEAGNKTAVYEKSINIQNENTAYDITPKNVEIPTPSYNITIDTNTNNTVYYRWKNAANNTYITEFKKYSGIIDTSKDDATKSINGTYILECKIVPPSGTNIKITSVNYVFDNEGPTINLTAPTAMSGKDTQTVSVYATDASDVASATGKIVNPDGTDIEGNEEFALNVSNGILSQNVTVSDIPSGSYTLRVTATDTNGKSKTELSDPFLIRNTAPDGSVNVKSDISHNDKPLISSENITLEFDISESFNNPSYAKDQALYYRIGTALGEYGQWVKACNVESTDGAITAKATSALQNIALVDGENTLFVQTAICNINDDLSKISQNTIKTDEVVFYYDETAPKADLVINDYHTNESISGKLYVSDNLGGEIFASCESAAVEIGEIAEGEADVTVSESTDTFITVSDASGNETNVKLAIYGIDKTSPTANIEEVTEETHGARKDSVSTVKVNDVLGETVKFAFIPVDEYTDGDIPEEYFAPDAKHFKTSVTRSELAEWDGENNITYKVQILGATGEWYLGVRSADSLGNSTDIVFKDKVLSAEDVPLTQTTTPRFTQTESRTIVDTKYNVPVYTLPQNKILGEQSEAVQRNTFEIEDFDTLSTEEKIEAVNFELAKQYAMSYSDSYSFTADKNGSYDLYTVDDLGRTNHLVATVEGVTFGAASNIKVTKYKKEWNAVTESYDTIQVADNEFVCAMGSESYVVVESADTNDTDTLFMSVPELDGTNGLRFNEYESEACYDGERLLGYSKLHYDIEMMFDSNEGYTPSEETDRLLTVHAFTKGADYNDSGQVSEKTAVISNVDNTEPTVTWSSTPHVIDYKIVGSGDGLYEETVYYPTPGNVTFTISGQDMETGIDSIIALADACCGEVFVPMTDANGAPTEYWSWDGNEHTQSYEEWDDEQGCYVEKYEKIPVKVEYFGDGDIYGVKTLKYTFTEAFRLNSSPIFINPFGAMGMMKGGAFDGGISTEEIIYKIPIEENTDFNVKYYYENADGKWEQITDLENTYYKNAKAVIEIPEGSRGEERGLYVSNNSRQNEKVLNNYQNEFTFSLKDKYGYTKDVPISLNNFDVVPGEIDYTLGTTDKTNTPYGITIAVSDNEGGSGIGKVILTLGGEEITLTEITEGTYSGTISQNGTYSITFYDNVGNKTVKSFNVKNIDTVEPTASVTYSTEEYTSRPVSATLSFSKQNVRITGIEPVAPLTSSDYSVNYNTSTITFTKSGTVTAYFEDDYGNQGAEVVAVGNIDKTPPTLDAVMVCSQNANSVSVSFNKVDISTSEMDLARKESEIYVTYGGITKTVADENGNKNSFEFCQNGNYTFKVHDKEGRSSYLSIEITGIDTTAPKITSVSWSYDYDEFDEQSQTWVTKSANKTYTPTEGKVGYIVAPDLYSVTNQDVNVTVETDSDTRLVGSSDDYTASKEKVYDQNGMFIFNTEKKNGLTASYGVDIAIIDKIPPTLDLLGKSELVFYENPSMNTEYDISMLKYVENGKYEAYKAYDVFNGKKTDLTANVEIDWGGFNPDDLSQNTFDSSKPYTITYRVTDSAHNTFEVKRTVRLVGLYDTVALVNDNIPDFAGRCEVRGDKINISLLNFAGTAYVRYQSGIYTMGQMKKQGSMIEKNENGDFEVSGLDEGWYTFYIQTDKRDYFTLCVYLSK